MAPRPAQAADAQNFDHFGNDMIQCFYDVATVTGEPVRARALKYVEQMAHRWKHSVMAQGNLISLAVAAEDY